MARLVIETYVDKSGEVQIRKLKQEVSGLDTTAKSTNTSLSSMGAKLGTVAVAAYGLKQVLDMTVGVGLKYNQSIEQSVQGLTALTVATSDNVTSTGRSISIQEKYNIATKESLIVMKELQKINAETPHTLDETNKIYKAMYVSMKNAGASTADMINLTKKISIAAGAAGIEFNSLLAGVDGLATGTVLANSDLGRFLGGMGLTNTTLKESTDVVALLNERFADFKGADTMEVATSNLSNAWQQLTGNLTEDIFDSIKDSANGLAGVLNDINESLVDFQENINNAFDVQEASNVASLTREISQLQEEYDAMKKSGVAWWANEEQFNRNLAEKAYLIRLAKERVEELTNSQEKLVGGVKYGITIDKEAKAYIDGLNKARKEQEEAVKDAHDLWVKNAEAEADRLLYIYKEEQKSLQDLEKSMISINDVLVAATGTDYDKWLNRVNRDLVLMADNGASATEMMKLFNTSLDDFNQKSGVAQLENPYAGMESQDWTAGIDETYRAYANISNAIADISKDQKDYTKAIKETNAALAAGKKVTKDGTDLVEYKAQLESDHAEAQLSYYSNLAASMAGAFDEGSSGAQAMLTIQTALSVAAGLTAIATAMANGDGYTAAERGIAVAATLASFGLNLGGGAGSTSIAPSYESQSSQIEDSSGLIIDRLDRQISLLEVISLQGTASNIELQKAQETFVMDYRLALDDMLSNIGYLFNAGGVLTDFIEQPGWALSTVLDPAAVMEGFDGFSLINILQGMISESGGGSYATNIRNVLDTAIGDIQEAMSEYALSMTSVVGEISTAADSFRDIYDNITGTTKYADIELAKAQADVDALRGDQSFADYLETQISAISALEDTFDTNIRNLLLSTDIKDLDAQQKALYALQDATTMTFDNGVEGALNFIDSIQLVGESMASSTDQILGAAKALDDLYLGQYSPLTMLEKATYANNAAYNATAVGGTTAIDAAYQALQTTAASAVRDEDITIARAKYAALLEKQVEDSTNTDIVNELIGVRDEIKSLRYDVEAWGA